MHTMAPTMSAIDWCTSPVQCSETKMRQVAIKVAMVMPEIGFDELPMMPTMRERDGDEEEAEDDDERGHEQRAGEAAGQVGQKRDDQHQRHRAAEDERERQIALGALALGGAGGAGAQVAHRVARTTR